MASILNCVLRKEILPEDLVRWLQNENVNATSLSRLDDYKSIRQEFIPYFLNRLRENTEHLFENGLSTGQSPGKKLSAKKPKPVTKSLSLCGGPKRSRLFSKDESERREKKAASETEANDLDKKTNCTNVEKAFPEENMCSSASGPPVLESVLCHEVTAMMEDHHHEGSDMSKLEDCSSNLLDKSEYLTQSFSESSCNTETSNSFERSGNLSLNSFVTTDSESPEANVMNTVSPVTRNRKKKVYLQGGQSSEQTSPQFHSTPHRYTRGGRNQSLSLRAFLSPPNSVTCRSEETQRTFTFTDSSSETSSSNISNRKNVRNNFRKNRLGTRIDKVSESLSQTSTQDFSVISFQDFPPLSISSSDTKSDIPSTTTSKAQTPVNGQSPCLFMSSVNQMQEVCEPQVMQNCMLWKSTKSQNTQSENVSCMSDGSMVQQPRRILPTAISRVRTESVNPLFSEAPIEEHHLPESVNRQCSSGFQTNTEKQNGRNTVAIWDGQQRIVSPEKHRSEVLRDERKVPGSPKTPIKSVANKSISIIQLIQANPEKVTCRHFLDIFVLLYSACLDAHLFPNLTTELLFITQLLTVQGSEDKLQDVEDEPVDIEDGNFFLTVHNAVYFATGVMCHQVPVLSKLDQPTLRLLSDNERVADFAPELQDQLKSVLEVAPEKSSTSLSFTTIPGVSFQVETDNRRNFPNDKAFHLFKKQRDLFYEVLREWEAHQATPGWTLESQLGNKIRGLVGSKTELANYLHLTRLFLSQLISMCKGDQTLNTKEDFENVSLLMEFKQTNPEKYIKLQERLSQPSTCGGQSPSVIFPGHQQFFRDFIVVASNPVFNHHLSSLLSARIAELNRMEFGEVSSSQTDLIPEDMEMEYKTFASTLLTLRLLARFLGFVTFLPYQSPDALPQPLLQDCTAVRSVVPLPLELDWYIQNALRCGRLTLVIPWVVEFLGQMDSGAHLLPCFQHLLLMLQHVLRLVWQQLKQAGFSYSGLLIVTSIGWLCDLACLPGLQSVSELPPSKEGDFFFPSADSGSLDSVCLVTQDLFYTCCPYIGEIRYLLTEFSIGSRRKTTIRKITLSAADVVAPSVEDTTKNLQARLEDNFFHLHPSSLRRTVEFVADRTASNFIKHMRSSVLPNSLSSCREEARSLMHTLSSMSKLNTKQEHIQQELDSLAQKVFFEQRDTIVQLQKSFCQSHISDSLRALLSEDESKVVISCATAIGCRIAKTKIFQWIKACVTMAIYSKEVTDVWLHMREKELLCSSTVPTTRRCRISGDARQTGSRVFLLVNSDGDCCLPTGDPMEEPHKVDDKKAEKKEVVSVTVLSPESSYVKQTRSTLVTIPCGVAKLVCDLLREGQDLLCHLLIRTEPVNSKDVLTHLRNIQTSLTVSKEVPPHTIQCLASMTVDLALAFVCRQPSQWSENICSQFVQLFEGVLRNQVDLSLLSSDLALARLKRSADKKMAKDQLRMLLNMLVAHELLPANNFS